MLIGGFHSVDFALLGKEPDSCDFELRCDLDNQYSRKVYTNNGRTATVYALRSKADFKTDSTVLLPDYLCVSVLNALEAVNCKFRFYKINRDLTVNIDDFKSKLDSSVKVVYVIHYFGIPQSSEFKNLCLEAKKTYGCTVVEDLTQTLYSRNKQRIGYGDYLVASTRKWIASTDGGVVAFKDGIEVEHQKLSDAYDQAVYRQLFISVAREYFSNNSDRDIEDYLKLEKEANAARYLDFNPREMTFLSKRILFNMNHALSVKKRIENYNYLYNRLKAIVQIEQMAKQLDSNNDFVPFGFPILVDERDKVYRYLAEHGIIGEIQWILPDSYYTPGQDASYLSKHNIMLQCDQRYSEKEMDYTASVLEEYFGGKQ